MQRHNRNPRSQGRVRFEIYEPRLVFTSQVIGDMVLDYVVEQPAPTGVVQQVLNGDAYTGLSAARQSFGLTGQGQTVVVIDSGIAYDHPALGGAFGSGSRIVGGWDFAENDANPYDDRPGGSHGTHVAGIIGSSNSTYLGVAPGVDLVALRVFDDAGQGNFDWVEQALRWVEQNQYSFKNPITTINLSIGSSWNSDRPPNWATLEDEFARLESSGIFISVAAGNSFGSYGTSGLSYPAASRYVVPVASVDDNGQLSYFSQRNSNVIAAPGRSIMSTVPDYAGNFNGRTDDFVRYSGTSMATPYVAGASALIRQAYALAGSFQVDQDTIYQLMAHTADTIYDPITGQNYRRLNLDRALNAAMPVDVYGSTPQGAHSLGTIVDVSIQSTIVRRDDADYFTFTAGQTGRATFSVATTDNLQPKWTLTGATGQTGAGGQYISFDVVAGRSYTIGLGTSDGVGHYTLAGTIAAQQPNWGAIQHSVVQGERIAGGASYQFQATRDATFTVDAVFDRAAGNIQFQVVNGHGQVVGSSTTHAGGARLDFAAQAGQSYTLRVTGTHAKVDFRLTNLVQQVGDTVVVFGTSGADQFALTAGAQHSLTVQGTKYDFAATQVSAFRIDGAGGQDTFQFAGTSGYERAILRPGAATISGTGFHVESLSTERIVVRGNGGHDTAVMYDSAGNDLLVARPGETSLSGANYHNTVVGYFQPEVLASAGYDRAELHDSAGNEVFIAYAYTTRMTGKNFRYIARGFDDVSATASGGSDVAQLYGTPGNETFEAHPRDAVLRGSGFQRQVANFDSVQGIGVGGIDEAFLYDSSGNDVFIGWADKIQLHGTSFNNVAVDFDRVQAIASGGRDFARLHDTSGSDTLIMRSEVWRLFATSYDTSAYGFERFAAYSSGGFDKAYLYSAGGRSTAVDRADIIQFNAGQFLNPGLSSYTLASSSVDGVESSAQALAVTLSMQRDAALAEWVADETNEETTLATRGGLDPHAHSPLVYDTAWAHPIDELTNDRLSNDDYALLAGTTESPEAAGQTNQQQSAADSFFELDEID